MNKQDQADFATNFLNSIRDEIVTKINQNKVPENWTGHEIRSWIADKTDFEISDLMRDGRSTRVRNFKNELIVRNL